MRITKLDLSNLENFEQLRRFGAALFREITDLLNGQVTFQDNFSANTLTQNFPIANQDTPINHGLGRVPSGYILVGADVAMSVYDGQGASTVDTIFLRSNAVGTARILIY